ncbi:hypothetical protein SDC9_160069 [bioreactor metagenome]|uniref:Uncharacterized protein n=1 Tax=bioreactor metagenome TaxID=1076179 RepID=A0A645FHC7_9ZZZZ
MTDSFPKIINRKYKRLCYPGYIRRPVYSSYNFSFGAGQSGGAEISCFSEFYSLNLILACKSEIDAWPACSCFAKQVICLHIGHHVLKNGIIHTHVGEFVIKIIVIFPIQTPENNRLKISALAYHVFISKFES